MDKDEIKEAIKDINLKSLINDYEIDKYEIKKAIKNINDKNFLGEGSYGKVYKLNFKGKEYAIKKIPKDKIDTNDEDETNYLMRALSNEVKILKFMSKLPNSVRFYYFYEDEEAKEYNNFRILRH